MVSVTTTIGCDEGSWGTVQRVGGSGRRDEEGGRVVELILDAMLAALARKECVGL